MPLFRYTAIDHNGLRVSKTITANSKTDVTNFLTQNQFFIVSIDDVSGKPVKPSKQLKPSQKIAFTQNIAVLLSSGISLGEAITIIADDTTDKSASMFFRTIQAELERGTAFSQALAHYPAAFDTVYVSLVEAGENSGQLDNIMKNLAQSLEKDVRLQSQVRSALLYPMFVLGSLFVLGGLIMFFVLPRITKVFEQLNVQLPLSTRLLIKFSSLVANYPIPLLLAILAIIAGGIFFARSRRGKNFFGRLALMMPFVKQIIVNLDLSRLSATLSLLLNAGVPIQQAMRIASGTVRNVKLTKQFQLAAEKLATGTTLAQSLQNTGLPKTFIALVAVGERSGNIASIFDSLAAHYDNLLETAIKNFTGIIEPVLTLVVGLLVGLVVITIMVPIYQFVGNIQNVR